MRARLDDIVEDDASAATGQASLADIVVSPQQAGPAAPDEAESSFQEKLKALQKRMEELGHPVKLVSGARTAAEQADLYAQGRTKPGPVVTPLDGTTKTSKHQTNRAADFAFLDEKGQPSFDEKHPWDVLGKTAKEMGLKWGGDFVDDAGKASPDRPHVEWPDDAPQAPAHASVSDIDQTSGRASLSDIEPPAGVPTDTLISPAIDRFKGAVADVSRQYQPQTPTEQGAYSRAGWLGVRAVRALKSIKDYLTPSSPAEAAAMQTMGLQGLVGVRMAQDVAHGLDTAAGGVAEGIQGVTGVVGTAVMDHLPTEVRQPLMMGGATAPGYSAATHHILAGMADAADGGFQAALPTMVEEGIAAPMITGLALAGAEVVGNVAYVAAKTLNADPVYTRFAQVLGSLVGGAAAGGWAHDKAAGFDANREAREADGAKEVGGQVDVRAAKSVLRSLGLPDDQVDCASLHAAAQQAALSALELPADATPEDIAQARKDLARRYHPDLNPDDPNAAGRMANANVAADWLAEFYEKPATKAPVGSHGPESWAQWADRMGDWIFNRAKANMPRPDATPPPTALPPHKPSIDDLLGHVGISTDAPPEPPTGGSGGAVAETPLSALSDEALAAAKTHHGEALDTSEEALYEAESQGLPSATAARRAVAHDRQQLEAVNAEIARRHAAPPPAPAAPVPPAAAEPQVDNPPAQVDKAAAPVQTKTVNSLDDLKPGGDYLVPPSLLSLDPDTMQYKAGVGAGGVRTTDQIRTPWNPLQQGVLTVWIDKDPFTGETHRAVVSDGHHRYARAVEDHAPFVRIQTLPEGMTAADARLTAATINLSEGHGTPIDAAKLFRDRGLSEDQIAEQGLDLKKSLVRDGAALSRLSDPLFDRVVQETLPQDVGVAIGNARLSPEDQAAVAQLVDRRATAGEDLTAKQLTRIVDSVKEAVRVSSEEAGGNQTNIFDTILGEDRSVNTAVAMSDLADRIVREAASDKSLFGFVSKGKRVQKLGEAGTAVNVPEAEQRAADAKLIHDLVQQRVDTRGPIRQVLQGGAERIVKGENPGGVFREIYPVVAKLALEELRGRVAEPPPEGHGQPPSSSGVPEVPPSEGATPADAGPASEPDLPAVATPAERVVTTAMRGTGHAWPEPHLEQRADIKDGQITLRSFMKNKNVAEGIVPLEEWQAMSALPDPSLGHMMLVDEALPKLAEHHEDVQRIHRSLVDAVREALKVAKVPAPKAEKPAVTVELPRELRGAKPRYNRGQDSFLPQFASHVDLAAYIAAQEKPSKNDAAYLAFAQQATGLGEAEVRALGAAVRDRVKTVTKGQKGGTPDAPEKIDIPAVWRTSGPTELHQTDPADAAAAAAELLARLKAKRAGADSQIVPPTTAQAMTPAKLSPEMLRLGQEPVGFGRYATNKVADMVQIDPKWVGWILNEATGPRAQAIRPYYEADPAVTVPAAAAIVDAKAAITPAVTAVLDAAKLTVVVQPDGLIGIGGQTYELREIIRGFAAKPYDPGTRRWPVSAGRLAGLADAVRRHLESGRGAGDRTATYLRDAELGRSRALAERRPDRRIDSAALSAYLSPDTRALLDLGAKYGMPPQALADQADDAASIVRAVTEDWKTFVLASDPGSGKTYIAGAAIREMIKRGTPANRIVYVTLRKELIHQVQKNLAGYGIEGVRFLTYNGMRKLPSEGSEILIFDEAHSVKNVDEDPTLAAAQAKAAEQWISHGKFTLFMSGTPYENPVQMAYLASTGVFDPVGGFETFAKAYGASASRRKGTGITQLIWRRTGTSDKDAMAAREFLLKEGVYQSRPLIMPVGPDGKSLADIRFIPVQVPEAHAQRYADFAEALAQRSGDLSLNGIMWMTNFQKRLLEASKIPVAIDEAQSAIRRGRWPVIFVETKARRVLDIPNLMEREQEYEAAVAIAKRAREAPPKRKEFGLPPKGVTDVLAQYMSNTGEHMIIIPSAEEEIQRALGAENVAIFTGSVGNKAEGNLERWKASTSPMSLVATMAKGGAGLSVHDIVGDHPVSQYNTNLPWRATGIAQVARRSIRYGMKSLAEVGWLFAENVPFDRMLSKRVAGHVADMGATVHGAVPDMAKKLANWDFEDAPFSTDKDKDKDDTLEQSDLPPAGADEDILSTGERQPRLPGEVGAVRDREVAQPKLSREIVSPYSAANLKAVMNLTTEEADAVHDLFVKHIGMPTGGLRIGFGPAGGGLAQARPRSMREFVQAMGGREALSGLLVNSPWDDAELNEAGNGITAAIDRRGGDLARVRISAKDFFAWLHSDEPFTQTDMAGRPTNEPVDQEWKAEVEKARAVALGRETSTLNQDDAGPIWRDTILSALQTAPEKGTAAQFQAHLDKVRGTKEQGDWIGLKDWFAAHPSTTKAEISEFIRKSQVVVGERIVADAAPLESRDEGTITAAYLTIEDAGFHFRFGDDGQIVLIDMEHGGRVDVDDTHQIVQQAVHLIQDDDPEGLQQPKTQYGDHVLSGPKSNYREIVLNLPATGSTERGFTSGHFEDENYLAHARVYDAVALDGKKTFMVVEVQSDRARAAREHGVYSETELQAAHAAVDAAREAVNKANRKEQHHSLTMSAKNAAPAKVELAERVKEMEAALDRLHAARNAVAPFPFQKSWPMLVMKRMIRLAVAEGYDRVVWPTGEQVASIYDLSKHVDEVEVTPHQNGDSFNVVGRMNGHEVVRKGDLAGDALAAHVGKEAAAKADEHFKTSKAPFVLKGEGLKVGGKWAEALYDQALVHEVGKFVAKHGAKVGRTEVRGDQSKGMESWKYEGPDLSVADVRAIAAFENINESARSTLRNIANYLEEHRREFQFAMESRGNEEAARAVGGRLVRGPAQLHSVHSLDLTPHLIKAAMEGMPLFQEEGKAAGPVRRSLIASITFDDAGAVVRGSDRAAIDSAVEELFHGVRRFLLDKDIPADQRDGVSDEDIDTVAAWAGAHPRSDGGWTWDVPAEEKAAAGFKKYLLEGDAPTHGLAAVFQRMARWLLKQRERLLTALRGIELTPEVKRVFDRLVTRTERLKALADEREQALRRRQEIIKPKPKAGKLDFEGDGSSQDRLFQDQAPKTLFHADEAPTDAAVRRLAEMVHQADHDGIDHAMLTDRVRAVFGTDDLAILQPYLDQMWTLMGHAVPPAGGRPAAGIGQAPGITPQPSPVAPRQVGPTTVPATAQQIVSRVQRVNPYNATFRTREATAASRRTATRARGTLAEKANWADRQADFGRPDEDRWSRLTPEQRTAATSDYERTGTFTNMPAANAKDRVKYDRRNIRTTDAQAFSDRFRESMARAHRWLGEAYGTDRVGWVEHYVVHLFKFERDADREHALGILGELLKKRGLTANSSVLKHRTMGMPLDEALAAMRQQGLKVELRETNPEKLRQWALNNAFNALAFKRLGDHLVGERLIRFVKTGKRPPATWLPLTDAKFTKFFPSQAGLVKAGQHWAPPEVAILLNRLVSKGLHFPGAEHLRELNAALTAVRLGASGFHIFTEAWTAMASDTALGIERIKVGDIGRAANAIGRGAVPFVSLTRDWWNGSKMQAGIRRADPVAVRFLDYVLSPAGGRLVMDERYRTSYGQRFMEAWRTKSPLGAIGNAIPGLAEIVGTTIMKQIPKVKIGAFMDLAAEVRRQMPHATDAQLFEAYGRAWQSIDNRFGLLTYDNLFWHRAAVDIGQMAFLSLGWNHGKALEVGGGLADIVTGTKGKGAVRGRLTHRGIYVIALPITLAFIGSIYEMLKTGHPPQSTKDMIFPEDGHGGRTVIKSDLSDAVSFVHDPLTTVWHKRSPIVDLGYSLLGNRDWRGNLIHNWDDPAAQQLAQTGWWLFEWGLPISIRQARGIAGEETPRDLGLERGMGFQRAPGWITQSPVEQEIRAKLGERLGERALTPELAEINTLKQQARLEIGRGPGAAHPALKELIRRGVFKADGSLDRFVGEARLPPIMRMWRELSIADRQALTKKYGPNALR